MASTQHDDPPHAPVDNEPRLRRITVNLPGTAHDVEVLKSAMRYAIAEYALLRIVLGQEEPDGAFQDQLHLALLDGVRLYGRRPPDIEVIGASTGWLSHA